MQGFIRFAGILNLAVWLGGTVFFTLAAGPAFFSAEMLAFLPRPYAGRAAEVVISRLFTLQQWCAMIALLHLLLERLYLGRRSGRLVVGFLGGLLVLSLWAGYWLQPRMHELQRIRYSPVASEAQKASAKSRFGMWHGLSWVANYAIIVGLGVYFWRLTRPEVSARFPRGPHNI